KLSRGCPRLPFWQGRQQPSRTVVGRLVDEIPLRLEGRSCDEHLFRTESDPERTSVSSSSTEELAPVAPTGADDDDEQASGRLTAMLGRMRARLVPPLGHPSASTALLNPRHGPWNSHTNKAIISHPIPCIRWTCRPAPAKPPKTMNTIE